MYDMYAPTCACTMSCTYINCTISKSRAVFIRVHVHVCNIYTLCYVDFIITAAVSPPCSVKDVIGYDPSVLFRRDHSIADFLHPADVHKVKASRARGERMRCTQCSPQCTDAVSSLPVTQ